MSSDTSARDACGCCEGLSEPAPVTNDAGLGALRYRVDTQPGFYARMLQSLPLARSDPDEPAAPRPLARLLTRASDDPTVAFLDASACVADVLAFYQERIANEGYLRTATERRSVLELARAIGYELKPGVAASVHLSFTVEDAPGAPGVCTLAQGTPVQSVPPQGKLPQVFETSAEIVARAEWNALLPRQVRPADMALYEVDEGDGVTRKALVLLGPVGSFPADTAGLHAALQSVDLFRLDPGLAVDATVDALEVGRVFFTEAASGINGGDLLLFVAKKGETELDRLVLRATAVVAEPALKRIRVDVEALPAPVADPPPPPVATWVVPYVIKPILSFAKAQVSTVPFTSTSIATTVASKAWRESDLQAMIGIQRWSGTTLVQAITAAQPSGPPIAPEAGAFAFGAKFGFFGNNAPKWRRSCHHIVPASGLAYTNGWDDGDSDGVPDTGSSRTIWEDSQGNSIAPSDLSRTRGAERDAHELGGVRCARRGGAGLYGARCARDLARGLRPLRPRAAAAPCRCERPAVTGDAGRSVQVPQQYRLRRQPQARPRGAAHRCADRGRGHADRARPHGARPCRRPAGGAGRRALRPARRRRGRDRRARRHRACRRAQHTGAAAGPRLFVRAQQPEDQRQRRARNARRDSERSARQRRCFGPEPALRAKEAADYARLGG